jgi:hypothetical protein
MNTDPDVGPDFGAIIDQAQAEVQDKARIVAAYYFKLRAEGVEPYDVLRLTLAMQERILFGETDPTKETEE